MHAIGRYLLTLLAAWIRFTQRRPLAVVIATLVLCVLCTLYIKDNLGMNTSTKDMLSPKLPWRQLDLQYDREFPNYADTILVVIEAPTPDQALDAADLLYKKLITREDQFKSVYYNSALTLFKNSALLFLDTPELQDLADNLSAIQPFLAKLTGDQSMRGLFSMLSDAVDALEDGDKFDVAPLLGQINAAVEAVGQNKDYRVSWHRLMSGKRDEGQVQREFITLQPVLDPSKSLPASAAITELRNIIKELGIESRFGARVRLTGSVVLEQEELLSVQRGTQLVFILSLISVTVLLQLGLGSLRMVLATQITLIIGLIFTAAIAALTLKELNLISVGFAVLYVGLGADFAIHYCLRYRELLFSGVENAVAIEQSALNIASSLFLCAVSNAVGFFAFIPTDFDGVGELGWISGMGMFISLIVTVMLLPPLLMLMPLRASGPAAPSRWDGLLTGILVFPFTHARRVRIISVAAVVVMAGLLFYLRFDYNVLNLKDPSTESVQTYQDLLKDSRTSPWTGDILATNRDEALRLIHEYGQLDVVDKTLWMEDFIPKDQDRKLAIIEDMNLLLGELPQVDTAAPVSDADEEAALRNFITRLDAAPTVSSRPEFLKVHQNLRALLDRAAQMSDADRHATLSRLSHSLLASLPGRLETLRASLQADHITEQSLPKALVERWRSADGHYLVEVQPKYDMNDNGAMREFVEALQKVDPRVIGTPVINLAASDAVIKAFSQAFLYSFIAIVVMLFFMVHRVQDVAYVLVPLLIATLMTGAASVVLNIPINFANIIALPLLLGIGVDNGIHIVHRFRTAPPDDTHLMRTSSARAVVISTLTNIAGLGNLAVSPHLGTASMGEILAIGIGMTMLCTFVILPSLLMMETKPVRSA